MLEFVKFVTNQNVIYLVTAGITAYLCFSYRQFFRSLPGLLVALVAAIFMGFLIYKVDVSSQASVSDFLSTGATLYLYYFAAFLSVGAAGLNAYRLWQKWQEEEANAPAPEPSKEETKEMTDAQAQKDLQKKRDFIDVSFYNQLFKFTVADGTGKDRRAVVIDAEWGIASLPKGGDSTEAVPNPTFKFEPTLYLYRDTGDMQKDVNVIRSRKTAVRLDFEERNKPLHYIDANVQDGKTYNYYVWVEVSFYGEKIIIAFEKKAHVARFSESFDQFVQRRTERVKQEEVLRAAEERAEYQRNPPQKLPKTEEALRIAEELLANAANERRVYDRLQAWCDEQELSSEDREVIMQEVLRRIEKA